MLPLSCVFFGWVEWMFAHWACACMVAASSCVWARLPSPEWLGFPPQSDWALYRGFLRAVCNLMPCQRCHVLSSGGYSGCFQFLKSICQIFLWANLVFIQMGMWRHLQWGEPEQEQQWIKGCEPFPVSDILPDYCLKTNEPSLQGADRGSPSSLLIAALQVIFC